MKKLIIVLAVLMCALLVVSCNTTGNPADSTNNPGTNTPGTNVDGTPVTTPDPAVTTPSDTIATSLPIVANGATEYKILRSDNSADIVTQAASDLRGAIQEKYGIKSVSIGTDFERNVDPSTRYPYEILVGSTNRDESIQALGSIKYNDFIIKVSGTRVVIAGGNDEKTVEAVKYFIANYLTADSLELSSDLLYVDEAEYPKSNQTLLGKNLSEYTLVCPNSYKEYASIIAGELGEMCGAIINIASENNDAVENEIIIASLKRGVSGTWGVDDYSIRVDGTKIYIGGGSAYAVGSGCRQLLNVIKDANSDITASSLAVDYVLPDREVYINDISKLAMHWDIYMDTPEWMLDFEEKTAAMNDPDGRLMSCLHRGEADFYPEDSIEGIISAIKLGADMIEIDPRLTKDGVLILMHDETLTRTTNFEEMAGKNGLPTSNRIEDWTYAQLQQLNLKEASGGTSAKLTTYKIPTLDEAMKVCANRIFIRLDVKGDSTHDICWEYEKDIWPLIQKYNTYTNVIFTWHSFVYKNGYALATKYKALMEKACGDSAFCFVGLNASGSAANVLNTINKYNLDNCVRLTDCNFSTTPMPEYLEKVATLMANLRGKARVYIDAHNASSKYETPEGYAELHETGINILLVDKGYELCKYISENFTATEK
ncbi:MAG: glycerophosphodiester phosphodiesterase family protein [Clostridia bacterium]|nr:glycerophosphodiester phosphodiesterase family protein [Clostridia bacterium]